MNLNRISSNKKEIESLCQFLEKISNVRILQLSLSEKENISISQLYRLLITIKDFKYILNLKIDASDINIYDWDDQN